MAISPYALIDPGSNGFDDLLGNMLRPRSPRGLRMPSGDEPMQLSPEQEQSLLSSIGQTATSGLASVGNLLDVPGSMVRDVLTLNNPLDQLLDPFGSSNRITGREMLTDWGWTAPNDPDAWELSDFAGFGAEVLTDPLSWFPPFALTKAGKLAKAGNLLGDVSKVASAKAGSKVGKLKGGMTTTLQDLLDSPSLIGGNVAARKALSDAAAGVGQNLDDLLGQPLRGSVGLAAPFMQAADAIGSGSKVGQAIAGGLDSAADWLGSTWPGRAGAALFSRGAKSTFSPEAQEAMGGITQAQDLARAESLGKGFEGVKGLDQLLKAGVPEADLEHMLDVLVEQKPGARLGTQSQRAAATLAGMSPAHQQIVQNAVAFMRQAKDALHKGHESIGLYSPKLDDSLVEHFPRYLAEKYGGKGGGAAADTAWPGMKSREDVFRNVPEGRSALNAMAADPNLVGPQKFGAQAAALHVKQVYGITDDDHAKNLAKWFANLPDDAIGKPIFGSPVRDFMRYMIRGNESLEAAKGIQTFLADNAKAIGSAPDLVPVDELLRKTGFLDSGNGKAVNPIAKSRLHQMLADRGHNLPSADDIANFGVPKELADEVTRVMQGFQTPHALKPVVDAVDSVTSLWKALNTSVAPAFHGRNMLGAAIQNWIIGELSPTLYKQTDALLREGKAIPGATEWPIVKRLLSERGLASTDDNALDILKELAFKHELIGKYQGPGTVTHGTDLLDEFSAAVPGRRPISLAAALGDAIPKKMAQSNPLNVRGFGGRETSEFSLAKSGEAIGTYTESLSRLAPFFNQLKRGVSDAAAAAKVKAAHVDYSGRNFTDFERSVAGRGFPFYKFSRKIAEFLAKNLLEEPGGRLAQTIRGMNRARGSDPSTPDYISETASIPLGTKADGTRRYLTGLGAMFEDPLSFGGSGVQGALLEGASRLNPIIKAPMEWMAGQSFFQKGPTGGRELEDLDPTIGRIASNIAGLEDPITFPGSKPLEFLAGNSPASRFLTTVRTATDPRKRDFAGVANLLTGVRVSDVSPAAQDAITRERVANLMKESGASNFERVYFSDEDKALMSPAERHAAEVMQAFQNKLAKEAKQRKLAKEKARTTARSTT